MSAFETARASLMWDATPVSNACLCEFMPAAPEGHVKVYLYGLMWARSGFSDGTDQLEDMSQVLGMDRDEIERALRYWERCRLVERIQNLPPRYRFVSVPMVHLQREQLPRDDDYEAFAQAVYAAFGDRRKLHGGETVLAFEWVEQYKLPAEVVLMLSQHMISTRGVKFSFKEAEKVAIDLCEEKAFTVEAAEAYFNRSAAAKKGARKVLTHLGIKRSPTNDEMDLYSKWTADWGFNPDAIREACKELTKIANPNFGYRDKVLEGLRSRSTTKTLTDRHVQQTLQGDQAEIMQVREFLQTLGISMAVIDEGLRLQYNAMTREGGHELVMLAAREVVSHSKTHTIDNVAKLLDSWSKQGIVSVEGANAYLAEVEALNAQIRDLMKIASAQGGCTLLNRSYLKQWQSEWRMPQALIELAAQLSRGKAKPMQYMHALLSGWHDESIANVEEALAAHTRRVSQPKNVNPAASSPKRVVEQQYEQRTYDTDEYNDITPEQLEEMTKL